MTILLACSNTKPPDNAYFKTWRNDPKACSDLRNAILKNVLDSKASLLALDEFAIVEVLGKPDENELFKRNQKFYYYYTRPGASCPKPVDGAPRLVIRFNAVGLAKEIYVE